MPSQGSDLSYTVPGLSRQDSSRIVKLLQTRLHALNDLHLTLKHIHWNVVGPHFIAVHEMLDPQVDQVRSMTDDLAERISTLGGEPKGTPGALVAERSWDDYSIGLAEAIEHLGALDLVYTGVIKDHREAMQATETSDPVTQDLLIEQLRGLELFQWFVRAHLESTGGKLSTRGATSESDAAERAADQARDQP
ncbi:MULTISPECIES: Dps family protein [unclassified Streptomyces]|uniref:Dps family protein n=1 Tax=unclassified Streptomyces TaxID=2593676 RepID=UPI000F6FD2B2|nr:MULTISPECIES: DNA starvation/stationary phase protection protein [unclassified Streptomyces]AZM64210.1 DNA starvation/stationary phase protection protein [Streptomyces sp. WAC 01438]RSM93480.1 DNA starvation/stationary phase protection protein [Streptomyces sp. WAC 01420]